MYEIRLADGSIMTIDNAAEVESRTLLNLCGKKCRHGHLSKQEIRIIVLFTCEI